MWEEVGEMNMCVCRGEGEGVCVCVGESVKVCVCVCKGRV